eukprot:3434665-Pyramimonas_sp.AAC.1
MLCKEQYYAMLRYAVKGNVMRTKIQTVTCHYLTCVVSAHMVRYGPYGMAMFATCTLHRYVRVILRLAASYAMLCCARRAKQNP